MKWVDTIARMRRAFCVQGWSVKKIVREPHVSRNTVRKIQRTDETNFNYEREREPMPVAVALGCDPALLLSAALPLPETVSELTFSGVLRGARAEFPAAQTVPIMAPAFYLCPANLADITSQIAARAAELLHLGPPGAATRPPD
jgi:hypothetical protein